MSNNSNLFTIKKSALPKNKVFLGILKYLFAYYSDDSKFIVPLDSNYIPRLRLIKYLLSSW